jgi:hypothetical protein
MQEIRDLKTRDENILSETIRDLMGVHSHINPLGDVSLLSKAIERLNIDAYIIYDKESRMWIFTDIFDDDLVFQDYFKNQTFVIVERDIGMAMGRGIHYRVNKKVRP